MNHDFSQQFTLLREQFRSLAKGVKIKSVMDQQSLNADWLMPGMLNASTRSPGTDSFSGSSSSHLSPFKSSESSHSSTESETPRSDEPKAGSDIVETSLRQQTQSVLEQGRTSLGDATVTHRSRKGHRKSREGCFNCKRRKIKVCITLSSMGCLTKSQCQETQPACENCTKKNLNCSYPAPKTLKALQGSLLYASSPIASVNLQGTPTIFTLTDMRLFHHFLMDAYPHLPVGNDSAWLSQVPLIAHHVSSDKFQHERVINPLDAE
jgi:hypothetical protein